MHLNVYYDTRLGPITFDFVNFLVCAEGYRQATRLKSLRVNIIASAFRKISPRDHAFDDAQKRWRVNHILMRVPHLLPTLSQLSLQMDLPGRIDYPVFPVSYVPISQGVPFETPPYGGAHVNKFHAQGSDVQPFRASDRARALVQGITASKRYFTISLRTSGFQDGRNSNLQEWFKVYTRLVAQGFHVYVIPDFEDALSAKQAYQFDWDIADFATYELDLRMALYEGAVDNLCVNNGVSALLWYSKAPLKMFKLLTPGVQTTTPEFIMKMSGVTEGGSPPFFQPNQKWVWLDDTADNILATLNV